MQLVLQKRQNRAAGVTAGRADLLDWPPGTPIGSESAQVNLRLFIAVEIAPSHVNCIVGAHQEVVVENFRRGVGVD